jgi:hypothetical protein
MVSLSLQIGRKVCSVARKVTSFVQTQVEVQEILIFVFFTSSTLIISKALLKGRKFNQNYFISTVLPEVVKEKRRLLRRMRDFPSWSMWTIPLAVTVARSQINRPLPTSHALRIHLSRQAWVIAISGSLDSCKNQWRVWSYQPKIRLSRCHFWHAAVRVPRMDAAIKLSH